MVDPSTRQASQAFYNDAYLPSSNVPMNWTGNHALCDAGTTSPQYQQAIINRVNYFRAMAGVPAEINLNNVWSDKAQQAALMMAVNNQLSHDPPASWMCYTPEGDEAASKSNLARFVTGPSAVDAYMRESGLANTAVGHRRYLLYPPTDEMGTGDVPAASTYAASNALWVLDDTPISPRPPTREPFVAWPPAGFVPYQVTHARWSFSYSGADFSAATVSMSQSGAPVSAVLEPLAGGYGDNTLVWIANNQSTILSWPRPTIDTEYDVTIANVMIAGSPQTFSYRVTIFDPAVLPGDYNTNNSVDAADYVVWRKTIGQTGSGLPADGNSNSQIDDGDYLVWRSHFGQSMGGGSGVNALGSHAAVPEPSTVVLLALLAAAVTGRSRRHVYPVR